MKKSLSTLSIAGLIGLAVLLTIPGIAQEQAKLRTGGDPGSLPIWEYKSVNFRERVRQPDEKVRSEEEELNELGRNGWELVAIDPTYWNISKLGEKPELSPNPAHPGVHVAFGATFYFKRPRQGR